MEQPEESVVIDYEPVEGVDYLVDLYALAEVPRDIPTNQISDAINQRLLEYHPDRLQGLAPEFIEQGETRTRLLNRAKNILLDQDKRADYDELLNGWEGVLSDDGTPVITIDGYIRGLNAKRSSAEIEAEMQVKRDKLEQLTGYRPKRISNFEALLSGGIEITDDMREEFDEALLEYDRVLGVEQSERMTLIGIDTTNRSYAVAFDYGEKVKGELKAAIDQQKEALHQVAISNVAGRLALLSGEGPETGSQLVSTNVQITLPAHYGEQSEKIEEIARTREEILAKRLDNFRPEYPRPELQGVALEAFLLGVEAGDSTHWFGFKYDKETNKANSFDLDEEMKKMLTRGEFEEVIALGFNVLRYKQLDQVDVPTLINSAITKYLERYNLN